MNIRLLAAQVLITGVSKTLPIFGPADTARTAKLCIKFHIVN